MKISKSVKEVRELTGNWGKRGFSVGLIPTMGYHHPGHISLIERARKENELAFGSKRERHNLDFQVVPFFYASAFRALTHKKIAAFITPPLFFLKKHKSKYTSQCRTVIRVITEPNHEDWSLIANCIYLLINKIFKSSPAAGPVVNFLLKNALAYGIYELRKDKMNWPFKSEAPITYDQFKFGVTFVFQSVKVILIFTISDELPVLTGGPQVPAPEET